jgi:hypothetical protein
LTATERRRERNRLSSLLGQERVAHAAAGRAIMRLAIKANRTPDEQERLDEAKAEHKWIPRRMAWLEQKLEALELADLTAEGEAA